MLCWEAIFRYRLWVVRCVRLVIVEAFLLREEDLWELWRLLASAPRLWSVEPGLLAGDARCSPTSSWWALVAPMTPARLGSVGG